MRDFTAENRAETLKEELEALRTSYEVLDERHAELLYQLDIRKEISAERDALQRDYNELRTKYEALRTACIAYRLQDIEDLIK